MFKGVALLFRSATSPQSTPNLLHISVIVCSLMSLAVASMNNNYFTELRKCGAVKYMILGVVLGREHNSPKSKSIDLGT